MEVNPVVLSFPGVVTSLMLVLPPTSKLEVLSYGNKKLQKFSVNLTNQKKDQKAWITNELKPQLRNELHKILQKVLVKSLNSILRKNVLSL